MFFAEHQKSCIHVAVDVVTLRTVIHEVC